jgi:hypothetical protein
MLRSLSILLAAAFAAVPSARAVPEKPPAEKPAGLASYVRTPTGYLMVLHEGDDVMASLEALHRA